MSRIDEIKARLAAVTPGPWHNYRFQSEKLCKQVASDKYGSIANTCGTYWQGRKGDRNKQAVANAYFIANSVEDLVFLLDVVELTKKIINGHGCTSPKDCGLHFLKEKLAKLAIG